MRCVVRWKVGGEDICDQLGIGSERKARLFATELGMRLRVLDLKEQKGKCGSTVSLHVSLTL